MNGPFRTTLQSGARRRVAILFVVAASHMGTWACGVSGRTAPFEARVEISTAPTSAPQSFALAPDGRQVTFVATYAGRSVLWLRSLNTANARPLPGTDGALAPFWSPDSRAIGFFAADRVKSIDLGTNAVQTIATASGARGGAWNAAGTILYAANDASGLMRVPAAGGDPMPLTSLGPGLLSHRYPEWLPDGRRFLFLSTAADGNHGIYLGSVENAGIKRVTDATASGRFLAPDWLLVIRQGSLFAEKLDMATGSLLGDPLLIAEGVNAGSAVPPALSTSPTGVIAYRTGGMRQLLWFDREGKALGSLGEPHDTIGAPALSPDGRRVAVETAANGNLDISVIDAEQATRITSDPAADRFPLWSPDGARIAHARYRAGRTAEYTTSSAGSGPEELLAEAVAPIVFNGPTGWSRDGKFLLFDVNDPKPVGPSDIWVLPLDTRKPYPFVNSTATERLAVFSPDGRWVAYQSNETGRAEIYVRSFTGSGRPRRVSTDGGAQPHFRHDGNELFYVAPDGALMAAGLSTTAGDLQTRTPARLFQTRIHLGGNENPSRGQYAVTADGRFLINTVIGSDPPPIVIVQNWQR